MIRHLLTFAAALSLLLCIGTAAMWVRSFRVMDYGGYYRNHWNAAGCHATAYGAYSKRGGIGLYWFRRFAPAASVDEQFRLINREASEWNHFTDEPIGGFPGGTQVPGWYVAGFGFYHGNDTPRMSDILISNDIYVLFPHWLPVAVAAAIFCLLCRSTIIRRRRLAGGRCLCCGYDLRASTGRCPECGRPIASPAQ